MPPQIGRPFMYMGVSDVTDRRVGAQSLADRLAAIAKNCASRKWFSRKCRFFATYSDTMLDDTDDPQIQAVEEGKIQGIRHRHMHRSALGKTTTFAHWWDSPNAYADVQTCRFLGHFWKI